MDEELRSLQLDRPIAGKSATQLQKHTVDEQYDNKPIERSLFILTKGDDIQKLSVIQSLPDLLKTDNNAAVSRLLPKIQQELPNSSSEFHIVASKIFKLLIEMNLSLNLIRPILQGIESKDPIVSSAWIETLLSVTKTLSDVTLKNEVLPFAVKMAQINRLVYLRIGSCQILGQIAIHPKITPFDVKKDILPLVQSLTQDCLHEVRGAMCSQLPNIAKGLASENVVTTNLMPCLVELANDENVIVRENAIQSVVLLIPYIKEDSVLNVLIPLVKKVCMNSSKEGDITYPAIAKVYGILLTNLRNNLTLTDSIWFLDFFKDLSKRGFNVSRDEHLETDPGDAVACREACAYNLPAVTEFVISQIPAELAKWYEIFKALAGDPCYLVRKTVAGCIHQITKTLGTDNKGIVLDIVRLLRDDAEEVLDSLVPNIGSTLDLLTVSGVLSRENTNQAILEIGRALLKCQVEVFKSHNWRRKQMFLQQLEHLPMCMSSDFIHQHFTPVVLKLTEEARARPVRSQAAKTLLVFLRYSTKENHRKWIRESLVSHLCNSKSCYTRHIFVNMCVDAINLFSWKYFKEYFYVHLLTLGDDSVSTVRLSVVKLLPILKQMLLLPMDRSLQLKLEQFVSKIEVMEKDRDVIDTLKVKLKEMRTPQTNKQEALIEEKRRIDEEERIQGGKMLVIPTIGGTAGAAGGGKTEGLTNRTARPEVRRITPITVSRSNSFQKRPTSASILDQHFYIDAGITLPTNINNERVSSNKMLKDLDTKMSEMNFSTDHIDESIAKVATVSVENTNIENMSDDDLKVLETSTTNITDDVKANLRKINNKSKIPTESIRKRNSSSNNNKRYSCIFPSEMKQQSNNKDSSKRRSLYVAATTNNVDLTSRIPIIGFKSLKKPDDYIKNLQSPTKYEFGNFHNASSSRNMNNSSTTSTIAKMRKKCESNRNSSCNSSLMIVMNNNSIYDRNNKSVAVKENVPIIIAEEKCNKNNDVPNKSNNINNKSSALPVLIRRAQSEIRK